MSERSFFIYWNELSFSAEVGDAEPAGNNAWKIKANTAFDAFRAVLKIRPDCRVMFVRGVLHEPHENRPFQSWLEEWLGKDKYRSLRHKISQPFDVSDYVEVHKFDYELLCGQRAGEGITRAHIVESWAWSFGGDSSPYNKEIITASKIEIDQGAVDKVVEVQNIASELHAAQWADKIEAWGVTFSQNSVITEFDGYRIVMYPFDHSYPHLHVKMASDPNLNAKYRIDVFEILNENYSRPSGLDDLMVKWIEKNREALLLSWRMCQRGRMPLRLQ